jgi:hypothetical protein
MTWQRRRKERRGRIRRRVRRRKKRISKQCNPFLIQATIIYK